ncbi:acyltransferase family protein [Tundrisphaera sp. TA3]|uniref:acyltransferase family protein n=1 Tax=Tundrisphaera sp. TA3 TaxID=3435775 RepID=UPI003EB78703
MASDPTNASGPIREADGRRPQLDGLRFLAFLAVFLFHARPDRCPWGWAGVQFFFALSGFLITRILILGETGDLSRDLRRFYWRRTLRIFPLYYALLAWMALTGPLPDLGWYLAYLSNVRAYLDGSLGGPLSHFWTLAVEEQFYLLYPLLLLLTPARGRFPLVLGLIAASKAFQLYAHAHLKMPVSRVLLPYCGEDLLWGALAGLVDLRMRPRRGVATVSLIAGVPLLLVGYQLRDRHLAMIPGNVQEALGVSLMALGNTSIVFGAWRTRSRWITAPLAFPPLVYLGQISYGLYAFHMPVVTGEWMLGIPYGFMIPRPYGALLLTIALASASWHFLERPINRIKDRARRPAAPGAEADVRPSDADPAR